MAKMKFSPPPKRTLKVTTKKYGRKIFFALQIANIILTAYLAYKIL
jgi:hypothetical protein